VFGFFLWLIIANCLAFIFMMIDKIAAERGKRRISESILIGWSLIGGSIGALAASILVRHKTRKQPIARILRIMPIFHAGLAIIWILASLRAVS